MRWRLDLTVPQPVHAAVHGYCRSRSINTGTLVRSLVHQMLLGDQNPELVAGWWLFGERYQIATHSHSKPRQPVLKSELTAGAHRALVARAQAAGCEPSTLVRGLILEALHGKRVRFEVLTRVGQMWDDETRYVLRARR